VITAQVVDPCLGGTNYIDIGGANVAITFKLLGPDASNILMINAETVTETRIRHS
jgi:hypothetical protein